MKTKLFFIAFIIIGYTAIAQVGVGTPLPNNSAQLDVVASNRGMLIPRVSLLSSVDITTITNGNVVSLLVYNTATITDITPGYYYWDGAKWTRIINADELVSFDTNTTNTAFAIVGTDLVITDSDGNTVSTPLAAIAAGVDTDDQTVTDFSIIGTDLSITLEDGNTATVPLAAIAAGVDTNTTNTAFAIVGTDLVITDSDGNTVSTPLAGIAGNETLTILGMNADGINLDYLDENGNTNQINLSTVIAGNETLTIISQDNAAGTITYLDELGNPTVLDLNAMIAAAETTTTMVQDDATGIATYTNEDGLVTTADVVSTDATNIITVGTDGGALILPAALAANETLLTITTDGTATGVTLSGTSNHTANVRLLSVSGTNALTIGADGGLLLNPTATNTSTLTQATGNEAAQVTAKTARTIATHDPDGVGVLTAVNINETVTSIAQDNTTGIIAFTNENGVTDDHADVNNGEFLNIISADANNAIKVGTDGGAYINATVKKVFSAEYAGATLYADGTNNVGMMTSDNTGAGNNWMNYYEWSSGEATVQDYDVILRFTLPNDFSAWDGTNPIVIDYQAEGTSSFSATMFLEDGTALGTIGASSSATWTTVNINPGAMTAGDTAVIILKLTSAPNDDTQKVRIGDITLNYTN